MKNLYERAAADEILARIGRLTPSSQRQWGKMDVAQMLAHCSQAMDMANGKSLPKRMFIGRILGPLVRGQMTSDKPFARNNPTSPDLRIIDARDFAREQQRLLECVRCFHQGGAPACTTHPHPFFGPMTPHQWSTGMYKHLDHHLTQFGV